MKQVRVGLIGTGYIGRCHAIAYAQAATVFPLKGDLVLEMLAEVTPELAAQRAAEFGFARSTGDWRQLVADPAIDVVDICAPNFCIKRWRWRRSATASTCIRKSRWRWTRRRGGDGAGSARQGGENAGRF